MSQQHTPYFDLIPPVASPFRRRRMAPPVMLASYAQDEVESEYLRQENTTLRDIMRRLKEENDRMKLIQIRPGDSCRDDSAIEGEAEQWQRGLRAFTSTLERHARHSNHTDKEVQQSIAFLRKMTETASTATTTTTTSEKAGAIANFHRGDASSIPISAQGTSYLYPPPLPPPLPSHNPLLSYFNHAFYPHSHTEATQQHQQLQEMEMVEKEAERLRLELERCKIEEEARDRLRQREREMEAVQLQREKDQIAEQNHQLKKELEQQKQQERDHQQQFVETLSQVLKTQQGNTERSFTPPPLHPSAAPIPVSVPTDNDTDSLVKLGNLHAVTTTHASTATTASSGVHNLRYSGQGGGTTGKGDSDNERETKNTVEPTTAASIPIEDCNNIAPRSRSESKRSLRRRDSVISTLSTKSRKRRKEKKEKERKNDKSDSSSDDPRSKGKRPVEDSQSKKSKERTKDKDKDKDKEKDSETASKKIDKYDKGRRRPNRRHSSDATSVASRPSRRSSKTGLELPVDNLDMAAGLGGASSHAAMGNSAHPHPPKSGDEREGGEEDPLQPPLQPPDYPQTAMRQQACFQWILGVQFFALQADQLLRGAGMGGEEIITDGDFGKFSVAAANCVPQHVDGAEGAGAHAPITEYRMKEYRPRVFGSFREHCGIKAEDFKNSWTFQNPQQLKIQQTQGKSQALFIFSADRKYILKTVPYFEKDNTMALLHDYYKYMKNNKYSLIQKMFGFYRFIEGGRRTYAMIVGNCVQPPPTLISRHPLSLYDLKGRKPKTGHYRKQTTQPITEDTDINRTFTLQTNSYQLFMAQLQTDVTFLRKQKLMDYSLVVGVYKLNEIEAQELIEEQQQHHQLHNIHLGDVDNKHNGGGGGGGGGGVNDTVNTTMSTEQDYSPKSGIMLGLQQPAPTVSGPGLFGSAPPFVLQYPTVGAVAFLGYHEDSWELYAVGIVDTATKYGPVQMTSNWFKTWLWSNPELSTVPPDYYAKRFKHYLSQVFTKRAPFNLVLSQIPQLSPPTELSAQQHMEEDESLHSSKAQ